MLDYEDLVAAEQRLTERALAFGTEPSNELYEDVQFNDPNTFYNRPAPEPVVAFCIGGALSVVTVVYWFFFRYLPVRKQAISTAEKHSASSCALKTRSLIATLADNDNPTFTMLRLTSQSMLFLGGFQLNYQYTFVIMLGYFAVISLGDTYRVFLSLYEANTLSDLIVVSKRDRRFLSAQLKAQDGKTQVVLKSANVYENVSRQFIIVAMVFITQILLISFVVVDVYEKETHTTLDGTGNVPILGTLGSWLIYLLGIFMQSVYILGPKTSFGTSEQNPHYWLQILLAAKRSGAKCKWYDPVEDADKEMDLRPFDIMLWVRFFMSFCINGLGFHILVHALPIQVAGQSSLTGVVFRAVGMMYLVDLDDAPGTALTLIEGDRTANATTGAQDATEPTTTASSPKIEATETQEETNNEETPSDPPVVGTTATATQVGLTAQELIDNAKTRAKQLERELQEALNALGDEHGLNVAD